MRHRPAVPFCQTVFADLLIAVDTPYYLILVNRYFLDSIIIRRRLAAARQFDYRGDGQQYSDRQRNTRRHYG